MSVMDLFGMVFTLTLLGLAVVGALYLYKYRQGQVASIFDRCSGFTADQVRILTPEQLKTFTPEQLKAFTIKQLEEIAKTGKLPEIGVDAQSGSQDNAEPKGKDVRGRHIKDNVQEVQNPHKTKWMELANHIEDNINNMIMSKKNSLHQQMDEVIASLMKNQGNKCTLKKKQEIQDLKETISDTDYCYDLTLKLSQTKELLINGTDLIVNITIDTGDIIQLFSTCYLEPMYKQLKCFLEVTEVINKDVQEIMPELEVFVSQARIVISGLITDFVMCYSKHMSVEVQINDVSTNSLECN